MKKTIFLLSFIIGMMMNAQVVQNQVFSTTEEISFVSDDGGGIYTVSGPGAGDDGFLAIYDENNSSWEYKNFPPRGDLGTNHNADVRIAYTLQGGVTIATGLVASSATDSWYTVRRYENGVNTHTQEIIILHSVIRLFPIQGEMYASVWVNTGGYAWNLGEGRYLVKINTQDLSLEWVYTLSDYIVESTDNLISTNKAYRYAIQQLPNGNIAVTVVRLLSGQTPDREYQLWEFDPNTGQKLGVIDDSNTDYDRDGVVEMQYRFHRWKVVDGVLYHEFWQDPAAYPDDQNVGHWEKLEVSGWTPGGSTPWDPTQLVVTAVSDWGNYDSFTFVLRDFWVDSNKRLRSKDIYFSEDLALYKVERLNANISGIRDEWVTPTGERMVMTLHSLERVTYNEMFPTHTQTAVGNNIVEARDNEIFVNGQWQPVSGEGTLVVEHNAMPQVGYNPDSNDLWWSIPSEFHHVGHTTLKESHNQETNGMLYFYVDALRNGEYVDAKEMLYRVWVVDADDLDNIAPTVVLQSVDLYLGNNGSVTITDASIFDNGSYDDSGIASFSVSPDTFSCGDVGTPQTVTVTVTNNQGYSASAQTTVNVLDTVAPINTTPATIQLDLNGNASVSLSDSDISGTDNCGIVSKSWSQYDFTQTGNFTSTAHVEDASGNGTDKVVSVEVIDSANGIEDTEISGIKVYPNPVEAFLTITAEDEIDMIRIYSISGAVVKESNDTHIYVGNLSTGMYIVEVTSTDRVSRRKIVKK